MADPLMLRLIFLQWQIMFLSRTSAGICYNELWLLLWLLGSPGPTSIYRDFYFAYFQTSIMVDFFCPH